MNNINDFVNLVRSAVLHGGIPDGDYIKIDAVKADKIIKMLDDFEDESNIADNAELKSLIVEMREALLEACFSLSVYNQGVESADTLIFRSREVAP